MRTSARIAACAAAAALLAAGCGSVAAPQTAPPGGESRVTGPVLMGRAAREPAADPRPYGAADTAFGLSVLGAWCREDPQANVVLSPASLATGLGMAYLGARGGTAQAMARVLHLPAAGSPALEAGLHARTAALRGLDGPGVTLAESDQLWTDPSLRTTTGYLDAIASSYGAGLVRVPLLTDPGFAASRIDAAIAAATRGHIPQLLTSRDLNGSGWVLTDALYLNADWASPFQASRTRPGTFTTAAGQHVTAQFLNGGGFSVGSSGGWTGVSLPYRGGKLAMIALLPASNSAACPALTPDVLGHITAALTAGSGHSGLADISLPKVSLSSRARLRQLLTGLGMGAAFTPGADFSGLSPQACCIGMVMHAATLQVAEKGTVASAATAVGILPTAIQAPLRPIVFDRPFLLLVTDTSTGEPLFLARVASPV